MFEALLLVSFGGPETPEDVMPFLRNVVRGRAVPEEARLREVAGHYEHFGGRSPINEQNRHLLQALRTEFEARGLKLPLYWGNRNWHPLLADTVRHMQADGVRQALAFVTSAYSSYSSCRQYREDLERARAEVGPDAPRIDKLRPFWNHPRFLAATIDRVRQALQTGAGPATVVFTAHSIPLAMATGCDYAEQVHEVGRQVADTLGLTDWAVAWQSRSGPPSQPWLEPDILDWLRARSERRAVVLAPIGFVSDHVEVLYDLDCQARSLCDSLGMPMARAETVGVHPEFVRMVADLVMERLLTGDAPSSCVVDCCRPAAGPRP